MSMLFGQHAWAQQVPIGPPPCSARADRGVVVIDGVTAGLIAAAGDRSPAGSPAAAQGPWFYFGALWMSPQVSSALSGVQVACPTLVAVTVERSALSWRWTDKNQLGTFNGDRRAKAVRTAVGVKSLESIPLSPSTMAAANAYVRSAIATASINAVRSSIAKRWSGGAKVPIVVLAI